MIHEIGDRVTFHPPGKGADEAPMEGIIVAIVEPGQDSLSLIKQWYEDNVSDKHRDVAMIKAVIATVEFSFVDRKYLVTSLNKLGQREWHSIGIVSSSSNVLDLPPVERQTKKGGRRSVPNDEQKTPPVEEEVIFRMWEPIGPLMACNAMEAVFLNGVVGKFRRNQSSCIVGVVALPVLFWATCSLVQRNSKGERVDFVAEAPTAVCGFCIGLGRNIQCIENWASCKDYPVFRGYKVVQQNIYEFLGEMRPSDYAEQQAKKNKEST